jgi:hypothetical protein
MEMTWSRGRIDRNAPLPPQGLLLSFPPALVRRQYFFYQVFTDYQIHMFVKNEKTNTRIALKIDAVR